MNPGYLREKGITILEARRAILRDYDICFSTQTGDWKHAMIDLKESQGKKVEGVLYKITDEAMGIFDVHEKIAQKKHRRIEVYVQTDEGTLLRAFTFVNSVKEGEFIPSVEYLRVIAEGAKLHSISKEYIEHILSFGYAHHKG